jgi:hypothetical protein
VPRATVVDVYGTPVTSTELRRDRGVSRQVFHQRVHAGWRPLIAATAAPHSAEAREEAARAARGKPARVYVRPLLANGRRGRLVPLWEYGGRSLTLDDWAREARCSREAVRARFQRGGSPFGGGKAGTK